MEKTKPLGIPSRSFLLTFDYPQKDDSVSVIVVISLLIISSYMAGHIVSYLSSITIEKVTIWYYDYPSKYLLLEKKRRFKSNLWNHVFPLIGESKVKISRIQRILSIIFRISILIFLLPWTLGTILIGRMLNMDNYMARPLDPTTVQAIKNKLSMLKKKLCIEDVVIKQKEGVMIEHFDFLRLIHHYEYGRNAYAATKMDNYVAIYGFLRSQSLLFTLLFWSCAGLFIFTDFKTDLGSWWFVLSSTSILSYICFMGFMKFYRRYTVENFMSIIVDMLDAPVDNKLSAGVKFSVGKF